VVPYGVTIAVRDVNDSMIREEFAPGAFSRSIQERGHKVKLLTQHDQRKLAVGRAVELREERDGLHASFEVARTRDGDELLELVKSGVVDSFSVGFTPIRDRQRGGVVVRVEAALREVSAVNFPAYEGAVIAGVRSESLVIPRAVAEARLSILNW
jgi:HK97 family phage prohead protease